MWLFRDRLKTLVYQPSLQAEVPPYPTALATFCMESEIH